MLFGKVRSDDFRRDTFSTAVSTPFASEKPVNMSDQSVVVKTRKFMKNPLLSRRQVRRWMIAHCRAMLVYFISSSIL